MGRSFPSKLPIRIGDLGLCGGIKIRTDTTKLSNVAIAGFGHDQNLVGEGKMFTKDEAKVASRVSGHVVLSEELCILSSCFLTPVP